MSGLPNLMVAPNGARHTKADHPALPMTLGESISTARACFSAGADGLHLHLRTKDGRHLLDAGLYREAVGEMRVAVPGMAVQITTEAVGIYCPGQQMHIARHSGADLVSVSVRELMREQDHRQLARFYRETADRKILIQHILYDVSDLVRLKKVLPSELYQSDGLQLLFVLGKYGDSGSAMPQVLDLYLDQLTRDRITPDWAVCAFGPSETRCLRYARKKGGKLRLGFENSFWNDDGSLAESNAERIEDLLCESRADAGHV